MSDQPHPVDIVGQFLNAALPPPGCSVAQVAAVIAAWNAIAKPIIEAEKAKAAANGSGVVHTGTPA